MQKDANSARRDPCTARRPAPRLGSIRGQQAKRAAGRSSCGARPRRAESAGCHSTRPRPEAGCHLTRSRPKTGCVLGIDYGSRRIGLAISDPDRVFAFPAGYLERRGGGQDLAALRELVEARGVIQIVVGLPIHMSGREGPEARAARAFAEALGRETGRSVDLFDERWTSREAERALRDGPQGPAARPRRKAARRPRSQAKPGGARGDIDAAAATLLLRTWLERRSRGAEGER